MTVEEHDRIDQVAVGPDGRLVLAMVEERPSRGEALGVVEEDFRKKLNSYVRAVRSGYAAELARSAGVGESAGVEFVLFSDTEPSELVREMIGLVNQELSTEGMSA